MYCPIGFSAEELHNCIPNKMLQSVRLSYDGAASVAPAPVFFNVGNEVILAPRYISRRFPGGFDPALGTDLQVVQTVQIVMYIITAPTVPFYLNVESSTFTFDKPTPSSGRMNDQCSSYSTIAVACTKLTGYDAVNTFNVNNIFGTLANSHDLFGSGAMKTSISPTTVRFAATTAQWYASGAEYSGEYFGYVITGSNDIPLYQTIRFTPSVYIAALHPDYAVSTTYIVDF